MTNDATDRAATTRLLLFGASGQVGGQLRSALASLGAVVAPTHAEVDLTRPDALRGMIERTRPDVVINAAALTNVDRAEHEPSLARALNEVAPGVMAEAAKRVGALLVHYSTDYVFDGATDAPYDEWAKPNPLNTYGRTKLAGEHRVASAGALHLIIRTSWVYSPTGSGFVASLIRSLPGKESIRVVSDQVGSPTWSRSLAWSTAAILRTVLARPLVYFLPDDWGVYHLAGSGPGSRVEIAETLIESLEELGKLTPGSRPRIVPISAAEFAASAPRPHYSALSNQRAATRFGVTLAPWRDELRRMLHEQLQLDGAVLARLDA